MPVIHKRMRVLSSSYLLLGLLLNSCLYVHAKEQDILITPATVSSSSNSEIAQVAVLMQQARLPGKSHLIQQALVRFSKIQPQENLSYLMLAADIAQQQHNFTEAKSALEEAAKLQLQPQIPLMQARIALVEANPNQAIQYCKQLLGLQELFLFELCSLEASGRKGLSNQSYPLLQRMEKRKDIPLEIRLYLQSVLAEQAEQLHQPNAAAAHLKPWLAGAPVAMWLKWSDVTMGISPQEVYDELQKLSTQVTLEDGLLLRLARSEQLIQAGNQYLNIAAQRINLRERRKDLKHSADLTYFYLFLQPDSAKAHYFAGINYQQAREPDDLKLALLSGWTSLKLQELIKKGIL